MCHRVAHTCRAQIGSCLRTLATLLFARAAAAVAVVELGMGL